VARVAITGTASFLGSRLLRRLVGAHGGDSVLAIDITAPPTTLHGVRHRMVDLTLPGADRWLWHAGGNGQARGLSEAMVRFAVRYEMARDVEDVLARRSRLLFLDAAEAARQADAVAAIVADELGRAVDAAPFKTLAARYLRLP